MEKTLLLEVWSFKDLWKGRIKITGKQNTEGRKSKWGLNNNYGLTWIFFVTTNGYCHLRRKGVLVTEPVHISVLKIRSVFPYFYRSFSCSVDLSMETCHWRYNYWIFYSKITTSRGQCFQIYQKNDHRLLTGCWYHYPWHCFQVNISENGKTF